MQLSFLSCGLCGETGADVRKRLVEWTDDAMARMKVARYKDIDRCEDRVACRRRVELVLEEPWPVNDRTPEPERPAASVVPSPKPVTASAAPPPDVAPEAEEVLPWRR